MNDHTTALTKFKLDRFSPITDDALLLNIDLKKFRDKPGHLHQLAILALFENKDELIVIAYVPVKGQRLSDIKINKVTYVANIFDEDGFVHKYSIPKAFKAGKLDITEYGLLDDTLTRTTFAVKEEHVFGVINNTYYYDSKKYYQTTLIGELFHDIIDMTTIKDRFQDLFGRPFLYQDVASLKSKQIKLSYVAFNLFDNRLNQYFVPDDIVEMKLKYDELRYVYQAKKVLAEAQVDPLVSGNTYTTERKETVQKELRKIEHGEKSEWNIVANFFTYKQYRYHSIYRLQENPRIKNQLATQFTYALVIGPKLGYRFANESLKKGKFVSYDVEQTTLKNIVIYHVTYQLKGHRYAVPVQSLVYESNKKSRLPKTMNRIRSMLKTLAKFIIAPIKFVFGASGLVIKLVTWIIKRWKLILVLLILGLLTYLGLRIANIL
jgi:hypothetical protein